MDYRAIFEQLTKQKVSPCAAWALARLVVGGRAKVQDLADQGVYTRPALSVACAELQNMGFLDKDRDKYFLLAKIYTENPETPDHNNPKRLHETHAENEKPRAKVEKSEKQKPTDLKAVAVKSSLSLRDEKNDSSLNQINDSSKSGAPENSAREKHDDETSLLLEFGQTRCALPLATLLRIREICQGPRHFAQVLEAYKWLHLDRRGRPILNAWGWAQATVRNGVDVSVPFAATFEAWKQGRKHDEIIRQEVRQGVKENIEAIQRDQADRKAFAERQLEEIRRRREQGGLK